MSDHFSEFRNEEADYELSDTTGGGCFGFVILLLVLGLLAVGVGVWLLYQEPEAVIEALVPNNQLDLPEDLGWSQYPLNSLVCTSDEELCSSAIALAQLADGGNDREWYEQSMIEACGSLGSPETGTGTNWAIRAIVREEDNGFWRHDGVDPNSILRAVTANAEAGRTVQGGSTITQQVVELIQEVLSGEKESDTFSTKIREADNAFELERRVNKPTILTWYINLVPSLRGTNGLGPAAWELFGKVPARGGDQCLDPGEAAFWVASFSEPARYDPYRGFADQATAGRNRLLDDFVQQGWLSPEEAQQYKDQPITEVVRPPSQVDPRYPNREGELANGLSYILDAVKQEVSSVYEAQGFSNVWYDPGGLRVELTIDPELQTEVCGVVRQELATWGDPQLGAGAVLIENGTPYVRVLCSSGDWLQQQVNLATSPRLQSGSSLKPLVAALALERGVATPYTQFQTTQSSSESVVFTDRATGRPWEVSGGRGGEPTLIDCIVRSDNVCFARLYNGDDQHPYLEAQGLAEIAQRFGMSTGIGSHTQDVLGTETSVLDLATAYSVWANGGVLYQPGLISVLTDRTDRGLMELPTGGVRVQDELIANTITTMLRENVRRGTGQTAGELCRCEAAGKTGTATKDLGAVFVGFVGDHDHGYTLAVGVWRPNGGTIDVGGGSGLPSTIWGKIMARVVDLRGANPLKLIENLPEVWPTG